MRYQYLVTFIDLNWFCYFSEQFLFFYEFEILKTFSFFLFPNSSLWLFDLKEIEINIRVLVAWTFHVSLWQTEVKPLAFSYLHPLLWVQKPLFIIIKLICQTHGLVYHLITVSFGRWLSAVLLALPLVSDDLAVKVGLLAKHFAHLHFVLVFEEVTPQHKESAIQDCILPQGHFQLRRECVGVLVREVTPPLAVAPRVAQFYQPLTLYLQDIYNWLRVVDDESICINNIGVCGMFSFHLLVFDHTA